MCQHNGLMKTILVAVSRYSVSCNATSVNYNDSCQNRSDSEIVYALVAVFGLYLFSALPHVPIRIHCFKAKDGNQRLANRML